MNQGSNELDLLESVYIEMDPVLEGFEGVLVELAGNHHGYVLIETALGSGNRTFEFASANYRLVYEIFRLHTAADCGESPLPVRYPVLVW